MVTITLEEPVLVTAPGGDPQTSVTHRYLPGSQLRGIIIGAWLRQKKTFQADQEETRRLFLDGRTRFLNAYPLVPTSATDAAQRARALPRPLGWHLPKGIEPVADKDINDLAVSRPESDRPWAIAPAPFVVADDLGQVILANPAVQVATHVQRDRDYGRSREGSGALYRTEALQPGQTFQAAILCDDAGDAATITALLQATPTAWIGGSRGSGYGRVGLQVTTEDSWGEATPDSAPDDERQVVTLLSDAIVRDAWGQSSTDPATLREAICHRLGCQPEDLQWGKVYAGVGTAAGFNRAWGLPLPQEWCFRAGTTLVVTAPQDLEVTELLEQGIGERQAEGFGRVGWNLFTRARWTVREVTVLAPQAPTLSDESQKAAAVIIRRVVQKRGEEQLIGQTNWATLKPGGKLPPGSQIQRLRTKIQECLALDPKDGTAKLKAYLKRLEDRSSTRGKLGRCVVEGTPLNKWLTAKLTEKAAPTSPLPKLGGDTPFELSDQEEYALRLRLMDQVLARIAKQARKERAAAAPRPAGGES
ncbi:MAG: hypothetical protein HUU35_18685 [Armatimonadetes bacterium]|nr:hypothetical protein [Armatimonadota bacterium]